MIHLSQMVKCTPEEIPSHILPFLSESVVTPEFLRDELKIPQDECMRLTMIEYCKDAILLELT